MTVAPTDGGFRNVTLLIYRIVSVVILVVLAIAGLDALGVFGEGVWQGPFYTLDAAFAFGIVVAGSVAMIVYLWLGAQEATLQTAAGWLLAASALATVWAGRTKR